MSYKLRKAGGALWRLLYQMYLFWACVGNNNTRDNTRDNKRDENYVFLLVPVKARGLAEQSLVQYGSTGGGNGGGNDPIGSSVRRGARAGAAWWRRLAWAGTAGRGGVKVKGQGRDLEALPGRSARAPAWGCGQWRGQRPGAVAEERPRARVEARRRGRASLGRLTKRRAVSNKSGPRPSAIPVRRCVSGSPVL